MARLQAEYEKDRAAALAQGQFSLDLNRFIGKESHLRLLLGSQPAPWRSP
ncbi:hypothetical protein IV102_33745 [bacterium]|nr:hypothetical protein [bacterium]